MNDNPFDPVFDNNTEPRVPSPRRPQFFDLKRKKRKEKYRNYLIGKYAVFIIQFARHFGSISDHGWSFINGHLSGTNRILLFRKLYLDVKKRFCQQTIEKYHDPQHREVIQGVEYTCLNGKKKEADYSRFNDKCAYTNSLKALSIGMREILLLDREMNDRFWGTVIETAEKITKSYSRYERDLFYNRAQKLKQFYQLSEVEYEILMFLYIQKFSDDLRSFVTCYAGTLIAYTNFISEMTGQKIHEVRKIINEKSRLSRVGLIKLDHESAELASPIYSYLCGIGSDDLVESFLRKDEPIDCLDLNKLGHRHDTLEILKKLVSRAKGVNVLLYGAPGVGKTSLARALGNELGRDVYFVRELDSENKENTAARKTSIMTANEILNPKTSLLVVDECDQILNTQMSWFYYGTSVDKSFINQFLTTNRIPIIWITNDISRVEESTKRRFSYSIKFKPRTKKEIKQVWVNQVKNLGIEFLGEQQIERLVEKYNVSPGAIAQASRDLRLNRRKIDRFKAMGLLEEVLEAHQDLVCKKEKQSFNKISPFYSLEHVTSDVNLEEMINTLITFEKRKDELGSMIPNQNILLSGPPGVGKSELCKYVAERLDKKIILKRASDIMSKWVGESEQNIAAAFKEAEAEDAILFIDECDSLLQSREGARNSWEVTQVNEMLTWLENHKSICFMATNFLEKCDKAILRRFSIKAKLGHLKPDSVEFFYRRILDHLSKSELSELQISKLKRFTNLTPGDFKAVYQRVALSASPDHEFLIQELGRESHYKKSENERKVGIKTI